jgi:secreted trypsin-like serine protease
MAPVISIWAVATTTPGCSAAPPDGCVESTAQALYGGSPDANAGGLGDSTIGSAVAAIVTKGEAGTPELCSGVLVAPRFVLSAAHCARGAPTTAVRVSFGPAAGPFASPACAPPTYGVSSLARHPTEDVMLLELESAAHGVAPVAIAAASPDVGQAATIAGYGLTESGTAGQRLFVATTVVALSAGSITVDSGASAGACAGDSGGPLFVHAASSWQLAGVLSEGSAFCTGQDIFVDAAAVSDWIAAHVS